MAFHPQAAIRADPAIGIHRQASPCQPGGSLAPGAEQAGATGGDVVVDQGDAGPLQALPGGGIQLSRVVLQLQGPQRPAASQRQHDFQACRSRPDHP